LRTNQRDFAPASPIAQHQAGWTFAAGETRFSYRSVDYCAVRGKLIARGFPVTGSVPVATFGEAGTGGGAGCRKCVGRSRIGNVNLAALNTKLGALVLQVRGGH
jgi:hypothetical protein